MAKRTVKVTLLVTQKEKDVFMRFAESWGMDLSSLLRFLIIKEIRLKRSFQNFSQNYDKIRREEGLK